MAAPEATINQYGLSNPAPVISYTISNAFGYPGYVVKVSTSSGTMNGTTALTDVPAGYTVKDTIPATMQLMVNVVEGSAQANQFIGVQALIPGQEAYLMLCGATGAIAIGDFIAPTATAGCVTKRPDTENCVVIARALEAKDANATGTIRVKIMAPFYAASGVTLT